MKLRNKIIGIIALTATLINTFPSCSFFTSISEEEKVDISSINMSKNSLTTMVGNMEYISITIRPANLQKDVKLNWTYDPSVIEVDTSSVWGVTVKGISEGQTALRCSYNGYEASCMVTVSGFSEGYETTTEPYIYSNYSIIQTSPGVSEKVFVSLFGGDATDVEGYNWSVDNASVVSIQPTGQYCIFTARESGYARVKVTHPKAAYPYYMGIYVFEDATKVSYITTPNNIVTLNQDDGEQRISVSLVNGKNTSNDNQFLWEILNDTNSEIPVKLSWNGNNAIVTPITSGSCTIRVTHPDASYPLDILCRVITIVKNVYIQPDKTVVTLSGESEETVTCNLANLEDGEYNIDNYSYMIDDPNVARIVNSIGNQVTLKGVANGSCKLLICHEKANYSREVLVIANQQLKDAVDASCYITTSQNYIRTKVGEEKQAINIALKGGIDGDEKDFSWSVTSTAADGSTAKVIDLETLSGSVFHSVSRAASATYSYGSAYVEPLREGSAVITITHPKIEYPTEILVRVLSKEASLEEPLFFTGDGLVRILNGDSQQYEVELKGKSKILSDDAKIEWSSDSSQITLTTNNNIANIIAPAKGSGTTVSYITISHPKADTNKKVLVMTADDKETLNTMKVLYSDKNSYSIENGTSTSCYVSAVGFDENYDFSNIKWTVKDTSIIEGIRSPNSPLVCKVTGLKSGTTTLTASIDGVSCDFDITVYPKGAISVEPDIYFTTNQNVISIKNAGVTSEVSVTAVNLPASEYQNIDWTSSDDSIATVIPNGTKATICAKKEGEVVINVHHMDSQNILKLYVRIGSEYVVKKGDPVVYISSTDVMTFLKGGSSQSLKAVLANYEQEDATGFTFEIDNQSVAVISAQTKTGLAYIKPVNSGQAEVTITHTATAISKKVLIIVGNSEEELAGYVYLTTSSNVVGIGEGCTKSVSVSAKNALSPILDGYTWLSSNPEIVDVTSGGATAVLTGNSIGTALITVTNKACQYSLTIIAQCVDPIAASANPFIQLSSSVLTLEVSSNYTSLSADLVGGSADDYSNFIWTSNDTSVCQVFGQNEIGKLRAISAGQTYITVRHPKSAYPAQILVVCDEPNKNECYISVPASIISMKPNAASQTITANLVNGSNNDKYNFNWSLDVYDVIDFQYSANVCTITPLQSGSVTITISHPKAAYSQQIIVNVQEYTDFAFPQKSEALTQGTVSFMNMQVPTTKVTTHVEYSVDNSKICSITGTKSVAQITGISPGTTTVRANLVATSTGVVQSSSEMLVYVKEAAVNTVYITSSSTIYTIKKGKSQSLSASLSGAGITTIDSQNLKWTTTDSDIISITGINSDGQVRGQSIYITALKPGEALITCSHEKAASTLQFYVVVPGAEDKAISLSKTYLNLTKGSSGTTLKATIENAESSNDYSQIEWEAESVNGNEIVRIMGNGQSITVYPISTGQTTVIARLSNTEISAKCTVVVEAGKNFSFETSSKKVQPFHSKKIKYIVSPPDAVLTWKTSQEDDYFEYQDLGCDTEGVGYVEVSGIKEGTGTLVCVTDGSAKGSVTVKVDWAYEFTVDSTRIIGTPDKPYTLEYFVSPADSIIQIEGTGLCEFTNSCNGDGNGKFQILPHTEGVDTIIIKAKNPNNNNEEVGQYRIDAKFYYDSLSVNYIKQNSVSYADNLKIAKWSKFENDMITLGDGEKMNFKFEVAESKPKDLSITAKLQNGKNDDIILENGNGPGQFSLSHKIDKTESAYVITTGYRPTYKGSIYYPDGTPIKMSDFYYTTATDSDWYFDWGSHYERIGWWSLRNSATSSLVYEFCSGWHHDGYTTVTINNKGAKNSDWGVERDPTLDGKSFSVEEFQKNYWYYIPAFHVTMGGDCTGHLVHNYGEIDTDHVEASFYEVSPDTSVVKYEQVDVLIVTISHNG
ncbi:MAG: hypothetical protein MJ179_06480, partial [Treponema sp.]|nr:hypothetical protein [Treponema sp.]